MRNFTGWISICAALLVTFECNCRADAPDGGLIAHYAFDEGKGNILHDRTGNGNDGVIHGATWRETADRSRLHFDGSGDWIDFGDNRKLKINGDLTIIAWLTLDASPFPDGDTNWCIVDCESFSHEGFVLRVDGGTGTLLYRSSRKGSASSVDTLTQLSNGKTCQVALIKAGATATLYIDGVPVQSSQVSNAEIGTVPFRISSESQSFNGCIEDVKIYNRGLTQTQLISAFQAEAGKMGKDTSLFGKLGVTPLVYPDDGTAMIEINCTGIGPLREGEQLKTVLRSTTNQSVQTRLTADLPMSLFAEVPLDFQQLSAGDYEILVLLESSDPSRQTQVRLPYRHQGEQRISVPAPAQLVANQLPVAPQIDTFKHSIEQGGGIRIEAGSRILNLSSQFSEPEGGFNHFSSGTMEKGQSSGEWKIDIARNQVHARGKHYSLKREITQETHRLVIRDTLTNQTSEPIGIVFSNRLSGEGFTTAKLAGRSVGRTTSSRALQTCPTGFLESKEMGVGVVALDDVFVVQSRGSFERDAAQSSLNIGSTEFALDANASYTLEWAVYFNPTADYYDFINAIRRDEGRNDVLIDSGFAMLHGTQESRTANLAPDQRFFDIRGSRTAIIYCLSWATDDAGVSIEGIEFKDFPKEMKALKDLIAAIAAKAPGVRTMFHVAPNLYATNRPDQLYSDSHIIQPDGSQAVYPYEYDNGRYFSKQRYAENWRWWSYYPTITNSFGKAMLESVDVMMDELGAKGVFVDGFLWGYGGDYTYDRWDGHSADIDPDHHTLLRKKASVLLLSQDAMIAYGRKVQSKGGVLIANNAIMTRTLGKEKFTFDKEVTEGPYVHLAPTPIAMGNPAATKTERDVYRDVRSKLLWGNLYMYYGEPKALAYPSVPQQMYPITVQEINSGCVKGRERIITLNSGVYGWDDNRDLHQVYLYDARGHLIPHTFVSTSDSDSVRSELQLGDEQTAVVKRVPLSIASQSAVNFRVEQCDASEIRVVLNGEGKVSLSARGDGGIVKPGAVYRCGKISLVVDPDGRLTFDFSLHGQTVIRIVRE